MMYNERLAFHGHYTVEATDPKTGRTVQRWEYDNLITDLFYTALFSQLNEAIEKPDSDVLNITHIALGTGEALPALADTKLGAEYFRKAVSSKTHSGHIFTCKLSMLPSEGNGIVKELGVFVKATDTADSGTLISHCAANFEKNANLKMLITWTLTIA